MMDIKSRNSGKAESSRLGVFRTGLIYSVATLVIGIIVLKVSFYIPVFSNWPDNILITGYASKILLSLSLLLVLSEIMVTRHPHYDVWSLAAIGGVIGGLVW